jgi:tellurite resistance protein TerC
MNISAEFVIFSAFIIFILGVLMVDLLFVGRNSHVISFKESIIWTSVWVCFALGFYLIIMIWGDRFHGIASMEQLLALRDKYAPQLQITTQNFGEALQLYRSNMAVEFITGYLMEYTLSIDNVFVIMLILAGFSVDPKYYKRVLFWGILGAIILRFIFIFVGAALIERFEWVLLLFGAFLVYSGIKLFLERNNDDKVDVEDHWLVKYFARHFKVHKSFDGGKFFTRVDGVKMMTPLFIVLILIEFTDLVFAFDSIPAIFAVTRDPYIVFFSNIFAILGLRSLFFLLSRIVDLFHYLKIGISFLLAFIGFKLLFHGWLAKVGFSSTYSLYIIIGTLAISIAASVIWPEKKAKS